MSLSDALLNSSAPHGTFRLWMFAAVEVFWPRWGCSFVGVEGRAELDVAPPYPLLESAMGWLVLGKRKTQCEDHRRSVAIPVEKQRITNPKLTETL